MKILLLLSFFFLSMPAMAQEKIPVTMVLRGSYQEDRVNPGFKTPLHSEGHFVVAPSEGVIWQAEKPFLTKTVLTKSGIAQEINGQKSMSMGSDKIPFLTRLYQMIGGVLAGDWALLEDDFTIDQSKNNKEWKIILNPRNADNHEMPFSSIVIYGHKFADKVVLKKKDGGSSTLTFHDHKLSPLPLSVEERATFKMVSP